MELDEVIFSLSFIFLPLILGFLHPKRREESRTKILFNYYLFIGVGVQGLIIGSAQFALPETIGFYVGWAYSPYLLELGLANFSYGILGVPAPWLSYGWKRAVAIGYSLFLLFTGFYHLTDIFQNGVNRGNFGGYLLTDLLLPIPLVVLAILNKRAHAAREPKGSP